MGDYEQQRDLADLSEAGQRRFNAMMSLVARHERKRSWVLNGALLLIGMAGGWVVNSLPSIADLFK